MSKILLFIILVLAGAAAYYYYFYNPQKIRPAQTDTDQQEVSYEEMRNLWFKASYEEISNKETYFGQSETYIAAVEYTLDGGKIIVLASSEGDASIYFESNNEQGVGGFIGGGQHQDIAEAAKRMVAIAAEKAGFMQKDTELSFVQGDNVKFITGTKNGFYSAEFSKDSVELDAGHPLQDIYAAAQDIITLYRTKQDIN